MIDKRVNSMAEMVSDCPDISDGATVLLGGFGDAGVAVQLVDAIRELGLRDLTVVSNGAGGGDYGLGLLIKAGCVGKMICTFPRSSDSKIFEDLYAAGKIELETVPQGTMAERIRAGGAGIPAFYTATAYGTPLADGKEVREFDGRHYVMEHGIRADIALVHAATADRWGNLTYRYTARNFNPVMATAASTTLVEVRKFVEMVPPEEVITPGIFVDRMIEVGEQT
jgi:3-oxoadipate CoA-transferase alpha subunit